MAIKESELNQSPELDRLASVTSLPARRLDYTLSHVGVNEQLGTEIYKGRARVDQAGDTLFTLEARREDLDNGEPILLLMHGLAACEPLYVGLRQSLASSGNPAATTNELGLRRRRHPEELQALSGIAIAEALRRNFENSEIEAVGHSNGGRSVVDMALDRPDLYSAIVLMASVGASKPRIDKYALRAPGFLIHEVISSFLRREIGISADLTAQELFYFSKALAFASEIGFALTSHLRDRIIAIEQRGQVKTAGLFFESDTIISAKEADEGIGDLVDNFRISPHKKLDHMAPFKEPDIVSKEIITTINDIYWDGDT